MNQKFLILAKTGSRIEHERELAKACMDLCTRILNRQGSGSSQSTFLEHEGMAEVLFRMNVLLAKDNGDAQTSRLYEEKVDIHARRAEGKQW